MYLRPIITFAAVAGLGGFIYFAYGSKISSAIKTLRWWKATEDAARARVNAKSELVTLLSRRFTAGERDLLPTLNDELENLQRLGEQLQNIERQHQQAKIRTTA